MSTAWEELLAGPSLIGRDFESFEDGDSFRGPIKSITLDEAGKVLIVREWSAIAVGWNDPCDWQYLGHGKEDGSSAVIIDAQASPPFTSINDSTKFYIRGVAECTFLAEGDTLEPEKVIGFPVLH